jgi:L-alanine-DL-glutamate epimerase-like enolase superfamily enzyme
MSSFLDRRNFLKSCAGMAGVGALADFRALAETELGRVKITDMKVMMLQGFRTFTYVKIETDSGLYGIGEGYGSPGVGIKEGMLAMKDFFIGKDPLDVEVLYTRPSFRTDGSAHQLLRAMSGIEAALLDLSGKILNVPIAVLLGGRHRSRMRMYHDEGPRDPHDMASCKDWADRMKADPAGWTAFKFGFRNSTPATDPVKDQYNIRQLTSKELRDIQTGFENSREAIGWDYDLIPHCHWEYDLISAIKLTQAVAPIKPLWLEDPMPPEFSNAWVRLAEVAACPIGKGENLGRRPDWLPFFTNNACHIAQLDVRNTGGLTECKKIADLADLCLIPMCAHDTGSILANYQTLQWACSVRNFLASETVIGRGNWMDDVIHHDGPIVKDGYMELPDKPGLGVELNPEVVKEHLADGEEWWG